MQCCRSQPGPSRLEPGGELACRTLLDLKANPNSKHGSVNLGFVWSMGAVARDLET